MPNVLFFVADDLGLNLGCYGEPLIQTPHIDSLASEGIRFTHSFASTASCSGSRSVMYTGLHTHQNGTYGLQHTFHHFTTFDNVETLPKLFNEAGYKTGIIGKVHVGPDAVYPWKDRRVTGTRDVKWMADQSREFMQDAKDKGENWCLTVAYMDPHRDNTRGGFANQHWPGVTPVKYDPSQITIPFYLNDFPEVREELAEYYQAISRMDQGVGMVLNHLEEMGMKDDTLIMLVSDNGPPFLNSKTTLYDAGVKLPMIVRIPGGPKGVNPSMVSYIDILPTFLDWAGIKPTAKTEADAPKRLGRSILPIASQSTIPKDWSEVYGSHTFHEITNYYPTRFLRTPKYKYHRNICWKLDFPFSADIYASKSWQAVRDSVKPGTGGGEIMVGHRTLSAYIQRGPEELYDLENDPYEVVDLAKKKEYQQVVKEMRDKVEKWQKETDDPWLFRDGVSLRSMSQYIGEGGWKIRERFDFELNDPGSG